MRLIKKLFKKEEKVDVVVVEDIVVDFVYKKKEIDLNKIDFKICPRFQVFLDMVRDE